MVLGASLEEGESRGREQEMDFSSPETIHELKSSLSPWVLPSPTSCPQNQLTGVRELRLVRAKDHLPSTRQSLRLPPGSRPKPLAPIHSLAISVQLAEHRSMPTPAKARFLSPEVKVWS